MGLLQNPIVYLTLAILLVVVFFQLKQAVESFLVDASGNIILDASGSKIAQSDLFSVFQTFFGPNLTTDSSGNAIFKVVSEPKGAAPTDIAASPLVAPTQLPPASDFILSPETQNRISSSIVTQIKDQLLAQRSTTPMENAAGYAPSDCLYQGSEYSASKAAPVDMSQYIRKDSIPCWGCTLPA